MPLKNILVDQKCVQITLEIYIWWSVYYDEGSSNQINLGNYFPPFFIHGLKEYFAVNINLYSIFLVTE